MTILVVASPMDCLAELKITSSKTQRIWLVEFALFQNMVLFDQFPEGSLYFELRIELDDQRAYLQGVAQQNSNNLHVAHFSSLLLDHLKSVDAQTKNFHSLKN